MNFDYFFMYKFLDDLKIIHKKAINKSTITVTVISINLRFMNFAKKFMGTRFPGSQLSAVMTKALSLSQYKFHLFCLNSIMLGTWRLSHCNIQGSCSVL